MVTEERVREALRGVLDPEIGKPIEDIGMLQGIEVDGGTVRVRVLITIEGCPLKDRINSDVTAAVQPLEGVERVEVALSPMSPDQREALVEKLRGGKAAAPQQPRIRFPESTAIIAVASGKGGVGKSSVTVNLASALAARGLSVGVLDADIWGFSVPRMLGVSGRLEGNVENKIRPVEVPVGAGRLQVVSMGLLVDDEDKAIMWRGLMLAKALEEFLVKVSWGEMDYLLLDMPPGTGDIQMALGRLLPRSEMIVVTTPALAAQKVAVRVADMARRSYLKVLGVIENMSTFTCEHGQSYALFGAGGGRLLADELGTPLIGQVPLEPAVSAANDAGMPLALAAPGCQAGEVFAAIAARIADELLPPVDMSGCSARMLAAVEERLGAATPS